MTKKIHFFLVKRVVEESILRVVDDHNWYLGDDRKVV